MKNLNIFENKRPQKQTKQFVDLFMETGSIVKSCEGSNITDKAARKIIFKYALNKYKKCEYCGSSDLHKDSNGHMLGACNNCLDFFYLDRDKKLKNSFQKKYGKDNPSKVKIIQDRKKETCLKKYGVENPNQSIVVKTKKKDTCLQRYGENHPSKVEEFQDKKKETFIRNYGVDHPFKNETIINKRKKNNLEKYGFENTLDIPDIQKRIKQTIFNKFGVDNVSKSEIVKEKKKNTNLNKRGVEYSLQDKNIRKSIRETCLKTYGVDCILKDATIRKRIIDTNLKKYGEITPSSNEEIKLKISNSHRKGYWDTFINLLSKKNIIPLFNKDYYTNFNNTDYFYKCTKCESIFKSEYFKVQKIYCYHCVKSRSHYEDDIIVWLQTLGISSIKSNEKYYENKKIKFELDIYLHGYDLAIDFNGIYWHSDIYKDKDYHQKKYLYFRNKNIKFIQIFENEWVNNQDIVKSIIKNKLKLNRTLPARKCIIKEVSSKDSRLFLELNHLQGHTISKINIGLFYNNELICLGSFGKNRFKKEDSWEIIRFCNKINFSVIGGFQKILKYFEKAHKPKKIVSFVDLRYFDGKGYKNSGFQEVSNTKPDYFYFKNNSFDLQHRINFQKHKLKDKLENFDPLKTEYENMISNGYLRIFDAGNLKMERGDSSSVTRE